MVVLRPLLAELLRMALRRFFAAGSRGRDAGLVVGAVIAFAFAPRVMGWFAEAASRLAMGEGDRAVQVLNGLFCAWALVPLLLRGGGMDMDGIVRLQRLPLTRLQLLAVGLVETLAAPLFWVPLLALVGLVPMALAAPNGPRAGVAMVLFAVTCPAVMLTVSNVLGMASVGRRGRWIAGGLTSVLLVGASVRPELFAGCLPGPSWVAVACAPEPAAPWLLLFMSAGWVGAAAATFSLWLAELQRGGRGGPFVRVLPVPVPPLPGLFGRFVRRGIQARLGCMEPWLALAIAVSAAAAFAAGQIPPPQAVYFALACAGLATHGLWANLFGGDGAGVLRTLLWPVSGRRLVVLHQACCLAVSSAVLLPLLLPAARLGMTSVAAAVVFALAQMTLLAAVGMHVSLDDPVPRGPLRNLRGLRAGLMPGLIVCALSFALMLGAGLAHGESASSGLLFNTLSLLLCLAVYLARLGPIGTRLEEAASHLQTHLDLD